jgi:hypothetical protein
MKQDYYDYLIKEIKLKPTNQELNANQKQKIECLICGDSFEAIVKGKVNNYRKHGMKGCKKCTSIQRYHDIRKERIDELAEKFYFISDIDPETINNNIHVEVKNKTCGHAFKAKYGNLLNRDVNCPVCNTERKRERFQNMNEKRHEETYHLKNGFDAYKQKVYKLTRESYRKHKKKINPHNYTRVLSGGDGYHLDHIISVRNSFDLGVPPEACADYRNLRMVKWKDNNKKWKRSSLNIPEPYLPYIETSSKDFLKDVTNFIREHNFEKYKDFGKYMLTLYCPKNNFGIYFADLKTNTEQIIGSKKYFKEMKDYFLSMDIKLLIIFEDEWKTNKSLVVAKILHYMGVSMEMRVHARNATIREISNKEKNDFLNKNHIQGTCVSQINLGAFFEDEDNLEEYLGAVLTFSKPRVLMNKKKQDSGIYELARFATANHLRIPGIASKMMKHFERNYEWKEIFSYADLRWSEGNLYDVLDFKKEVINPPSYHYVIDGVRKHRWGYRKDLLREKWPDKYDDTLTEYHNMLNMGYDRVWDCGTIKYTKEKS